MSGHDALPSSFRDPAGFLYQTEQILYRQVNAACAEDYDKLISSGLYEALVKAKLMIAHEEVGLEFAANDQAYKVLQPVRISYISYPHEWCFSQLKDAALTTIRIQRIALRFGMVLKDASAYNIQFQNGRAVFIDTLSFTEYHEGEPWIAYRQFCQHFIAPLALMSLTDVSLAQLFRIYIDGLPLNLTSRLLPLRSYLNYSLLSHIHLHARAQARYADSAPQQAAPKKPTRISHKAYSALLQSIHSTIKGFNWKLPATEWGEYYNSTNYQDQSMQHKEQLLEDYLQSIPVGPKLVHDLGANNGHFSRIASRMGFNVISQDIDPVAVEKNYLLSQQQKDRNILPLILDLTNPSPAIGWSLNERMSLTERIEGEIVLALALIHHLAISNNVPLSLIARFFSKLASTLIIEFVPKSDSQVQRLLASRKDIFENYTQQCFELEFAKYFKLTKQTSIQASERTLYLMTNNEEF